MNKKKLLLGLVFVFSCFVGAIIFAQKTNANLDTIDSASLNWEGAKQLTTNANASQGAIRPSIAISPDGQRIIVAYMYKTGSNAQDADPYYQFSNNYGKNWTSSPSPIRQSADASRYVNVTIDANKNGHAVWTEKDNELWYRKESNWTSGGSNSRIFGGTSAGTFLIESPKIEAYGTNTLFLVWSNTEASGNDILFSRSFNGGTSWGSSKNISFSGGESILPDMAVDDSGNIHVVWQEQVNTDYVILYSRSTNSGTNWSNPIPVSNVTGVNPKVYNQPTIYVRGNQIHVAFENRVSEQNQNAFYASCSKNCNSLSNWSGSKVSTQNYSVKDSDPAYLKPQMVMNGNCPLIMFSSIIGNPTASDERIRISSGCESWSKNPVISSVQGVMGTNQRAVAPSATTANGWYIHLAFERKDGSAATDVSQIFVTRNMPGLYLPVILKR